MPGPGYPCLKVKVLIVYQKLGEARLPVPLLSGEVFCKPLAVCASVSLTVGSVTAAPLSMFVISGESLDDFLEARPLPLPLPREFKLANKDCVSNDNLTKSGLCVVRTFIVALFGVNIKTQLFLACWYFIASINKAVRVNDACLVFCRTVVTYADINIIIKTFKCNTLSLLILIYIFGLPILVVNIEFCW